MPAGIARLPAAMSWRGFRGAQHKAQRRTGFSQRSCRGHPTCVQMNTWERGAKDSPGVHCVSRTWLKRVFKPIFILARGTELGLGCDLDPMVWDEPTRLPEQREDAGAPRARRLALKICAFSALHWLFAFFFFFVNTSCFVEEESAFSLRAELGSFHPLGYSLVGKEEIANIATIP